MPQRISKETEEQIVKIYTTRNNDGTWTGSSTIASMFGVSQETVFNVLRRYNIPSRDAQESHAHGKQCKPTKNIAPDEAPPLCKCGCGDCVAWNRRKNKWDAFADGHYRGYAPYKDRQWLEREYSTRSIEDIARSCSVSETTVRKFMRKFGIAVRDTGETLSLTGAMRGANNPAWKGGVAAWDYSYDWKTVCKKIKDRDNWTCQHCGEQRKRWGFHLHVHHIDGNKLNNDPSNLVSLCASCHRKVHAFR